MRAIPRDETLLLDRTYERFPFVPSDVEGQDRRCREVYEIQVQGLAKRLQFTGVDKVVIGVSGGLDSTQALIVAVRAMDIMQLPRTNVLGCLLPGFASSSRTMGQARRLLDALGCTREEIDIRPSCLQMFQDIGHPYASGEPVYDITFENVQAGERTSHLFRLANLRRGLVVGTSDLSELALGWSTYGVGDHMAHYHVNSSVPKTLIQYLIRWVARKAFFGAGGERCPGRCARYGDKPRACAGRERGRAGPVLRRRARPFRLAGFHALLCASLWFSPAESGLSFVDCLARQGKRPLARRPRREAEGLYHRRDQALAVRIYRALLRVQPV